MQMTPIIAVHMTAALAATAVGPVALWARMGRQKRPALHRAFGHAWVSMMILAALSALFIRDFRLPNIAGFTPIHILIPWTVLMLVLSFRALFKGDVKQHKAYMQRTYIGACIVAGLFTLLPGRFLGQLIWGQWLGVL